MDWSHTVLLVPSSTFSEISFPLNYVQYDMRLGMVCVVCSASFIKKEEYIMMRTHESSTDVAAQAKPRYESIRGCHFF